MSAVPLCDACVVAAVSARDTGGVVECLCGARHGAAPLRLARAPRVGAEASPHLEPTAAPRGRSERIWRGDPDIVPRAVAPLARAGALATALRPDDPELVRVRSLLARLRPDCADPLAPPVEAASVTSAAPMPRDPSAAWGGIPRGFGAGESAVLDWPVAVAVQALAEVLAEVDALEAPHPAVLRWARGEASLADGLRGLYVDLGVWAAQHGLAPDGTLAAWNANLGARREGAHALGRRVLLAAARAWGC